MKKVQIIIQCEPTLDDGFIKTALQEACDNLPSGFKLQRLVFPNKQKEKLITLGELSLDNFFNRFELNEKIQTFQFGDKSYNVKMQSHRYSLFQDSVICVSCGLQGSKFLLQKRQSDLQPHFNLYAIEDGKLVLMTKDHVLPKSKGGKDGHENYMTMCYVCNNLKADFQITPEQVGSLRKLRQDNIHLPKKQLSKLISDAREKLVAATLQSF